MISPTIHYIISCKYKSLQCLYTKYLIVYNNIVYYQNFCTNAHKYINTLLRYETNHNYCLYVIIDSLLEHYMYSQPCPCVSPLIFYYSVLYSIFILSTKLILS